VIGRGVGLELQSKWHGGILRRLRKDFSDSVARNDRVSETNDGPCLQITRRFSGSMPADHIPVGLIARCIRRLVWRLAVHRLALEGVT
jgi:hypothetical protein